MATLSNPAEIARETLKQMMAKRMAPSPDNYREVYNAIAGIVEPVGGFPETEFKAFLAQLPQETPVQQRLIRLLEQAVQKRDWDEFGKPLIEFIQEQSNAAELPWNELIADLLRQWETKQNGLTPGRKRESLDHVLSTAGKNSTLLFPRLQNLARSWAQVENDQDDIELVDSVIDPTNGTGVGQPGGGTSGVTRASQILPELREVFAFAFETIIATLLDDEAELATQARAFATTARGVSTLKGLQKMQADIKRFAFRLEFVAEDRSELRSGVLKLLQLMIENINELVVDDRWLSGQIEIVREIVAHPMNTRALNDAEQRLKDVIFKQSQLKLGLADAKAAMKQLLAGFVDHLAEFADSTSGYHDKIERSVEKIKQADDISQLEDILAEVIRETQAIQLNAQRSRDDLSKTKQQVEAAERRISELQAELDKASLLVRHDQLTGALNRRGLDEIYNAEFARAHRRDSVLSVAMLDIDNFKKLNDTLGHEAGDAAIIHLVAVIRETLRPQDTLARFGGEEFIILLPDTTVDDAVKALMRLQRELTKRYFLNNNEKLLITFSAGVTECRRDDVQAAVIKRADEAMYQAKKTGKNRVIAA